MGSTCEIQLYDDSRIHAKQIVRDIATEVHRIEKKYSRHRNDSFVTDINLSAGSDMGIRLDNETRALFNHALNCYEQSEGLFDITAGILYRIWDFRQPRVPSQELIDKARNFVGFHKLSWRNSRLKMPAGMEIDFGGIVKAYTADAAAGLARKLGVRHGLVNLGGDFAVIGPQTSDSAWTVGIANPKSHSSLIAKIDLLEGGLATSGDYDRCFTVNGKHYSHILNPKTGWPSNGLRAVSVAANLCTHAASMATIALLKPEAEGIAYLAASGLPHVYMTNAEQITGVGVKT